MMSKPRNMNRNILIQIVLIPVFIASIILFSDNSVAQEVKKVITPSESIPDQSSSNEEDKLQEAFDQLLKPYIKEKNGRKVYYGIDKATQKKLIPIYEQMTDAQKERQIVQYMRGLKKRKPSQEEFEKWKDPAQYGVWLNDKRINNTDLNNYSHTDIAHYFKSRLAKNAKNYGKHVYQVDIKTNEAFEAYNTRLNTNPYLVFSPMGKKN